MLPFLLVFTFENSNPSCISFKLPFCVMVNVASFLKSMENYEKTEIFTPIKNCFDFKYCCDDALMNGLRFFRLIKNGFNEFHNK